MPEPRDQNELFAFAESSKGDVGRSEALLELLDERHAVYAGADSFAVARMRGALLSALSHHALSARALPFALEELESADDPRLTAIAAAALRRHPDPRQSFVAPLLSALQLIHPHDAVVELSGKPTTATEEVLQTLRWLVEAGSYSRAELESSSAQLLEPASRARLLDGLVEGAPWAAVESKDVGEDLSRHASRLPRELHSLAAEDQTGMELTLGEALGGATTLVVFFFTRCGNPMKCPATMTRLVVVQRKIERACAPIRTVAFTYDPDYDTAERLRHYARSWGLEPSAKHRLLRVPRSFELLRAHFELGVGYGPGGVNRHQLEVFVLDREMTLVRALRRKRWTEEQLMKAAAEVDGSQ